MEALTAMMQRLVDETRTLNERIASIDNRVRGLEEALITVDFSDRTPAVAEEERQISEVIMSTPVTQLSGEKAPVPPVPVPETKPAEVSVSTPPATPTVQFQTASPSRPPPPPPPPAPPAETGAATSAGADDGDGEGSSEGEDSSDDTNMYGATGLPKTPKENRGKKKKIKHQISKMSSTHAYRRETIMEHSIKDASAKAATVTVYGVQESYEHIRLRSITPSAVLKFFEDEKNYERKTLVQLRLPPLVEDNVKNRIMAVDPVKYGDQKFPYLTHMELYEVLLSLFRPKSSIAFYELLSKNVEFVFSGKYRPTAEYFEPFYASLLIYKATFLKYYEIFAFRNPANIPNCDYKEWGLLKLFNSKILFEYPSRLCQVMRNKKWETIYDYLNDFYDLVEKDKIAAEGARMLKDHFGGTDYKTRKFDGNGESHRIHNIDYVEQNEHDEDDGEEFFEEPSRFPEDDFDHELSNLQHPGTSKPPFRPQVPSGAQPVREPLVCITKILHGTCTKADCRYDHREHAVLAKRRDFQGLIAKQLDQKPTSSGPHKPAFNAQRTPHRPPQRASNLEGPAEDDEEY